VSLLAADVTRDPLVPDDGAIRIREVSADPALLAEHAAAPERRDWWLHRLRRAHAEFIKSLEFTGSSSG
jgi:o-succinylbenzoate synthase